MTRFAQTFTFRYDVTLESLWRAVSDTDAVDRGAGLPAVRYAYEEREGGRVAIAHARLGPFALTWDESPFTWAAPHRIAVERRFRGGPFERWYSDVRLVRDGDATRVEHAVEIDARNALGMVLAPLVLARGRAGAHRAYGRAAEHARETPADLRAACAAVPAFPPAAPARVTRFADTFEALRPHTEHEPQIAARLASLVEHADGTTLARLRPYVLADTWALPRERVLSAMLAAARGGLLDISWTLVCPTCRGQTTSVASLAVLGTAVRCEPCDIAYDADFDRNVEVTFDARPSRRTAANPVSPWTGPQSAPQTLAQTGIPAGGTVTLEVMLVRGSYVVQALPGRTARFTAEDNAGGDTLDVRVGDDLVRAGTSAVCAGPVRVRVANASARDAVVRVTQAPFSEQIATAARVTALQAFRDLFPSELPADGAELAVRALTVVFSDIVGSTNGSADGGDAGSFRLVRGHVEALRDLVALHRGAIVKTIGDEVMAVFVDPRDALEAAVQYAAIAAPLALRIGIHRGACLAVRANERLDYFGGTVNVASRVAHAAGAGEVLVTSAIADDAQVADLVADGERGTLTLRGSVAPIDVVRLPARRLGANPR